MSIYLGGEDQLPDPALEVIHGVGTTPAYRGTAYVVFNKKDLTERRGSIPSYRFEVVSTNTAGTDGTPANWWMSQIGATGTGKKTWFTDDFLTWNPSTGAGGYTRTVEGPFTSGEMAFLGRAVLYGGDDSTEYARVTDLTPSNPMPSTSITMPASALENEFPFQRDLVNPYIGYNIAHVTLDGGMTLVQFDQPDTGALATGQLYGLVRNALGRWIGSAYGLCYSSDPIPTTWEALPNLPSGDIVKADPRGMDVSPTAICVLCDGNNRVYRSNGITGTSWALSDEFVDIPSVIRYLPSSGYWIIGTFNDDYSRLLMSYDDGASWNEVQRGGSDGGIVDSNVRQIYEGGGRIVVTTETQIITSSDDGVTWAVAPLPTSIGGTNFSLTYVGNGDFNVVPVSGDPYPLADIVEFCCNRVGIDSSDIDLSELTDQVKGFVIAGSYSAAESIRSLQRAYFFDAAEWDGVLHFPKRGGAVVDSFTEDDLLDSPEEATREQELEFPKKLHLVYQDAEIGYAATKQTTTRSSPDIRVFGEATVEVPVVLEKDEAA